MAETEDLNKLILGVVIVSLFLIIGIYIVATLQTSFEAPGTGGSSVNETVLTVNEAGTSFSVANLKSVSCGSVSLVLNATDDVVIPASNYTQTGCSIATKTGTAPWFNNTNWKVTYAYTWQAPTSASNASGDIVTGLSTGTPWITILVIVGFAVIVIGFLTSGFKGTRQELPSY